METCAPDGAGAEEKMTVVIIFNGRKRKADHSFQRFPDKSPAESVSAFAALQQTLAIYFFCF